MLREEVNEMLDVFDEYKIPEERQRNLILNGLCFDFSCETFDPHVKNRFLNAFELSQLLIMCKDLSIDLDVSHMLDKPCDLKYEKLLNAFDYMMENKDNYVKRKIK